jgi:hypothetical protein
MFGTNETTKPTAAKNEAVKEEKTEVKSSGMTDEEKKAARKASAQKMMEHKKAAIKTLVEYAQRMNADGKDAAVKEAADYLSGAQRAAGSGDAAKVSVLDQIFKDSKSVKAVDIFMNFEKGRSEMITLCKRAAAKGIIVEYDEKTKTYTRK